jgi:hypothetical protein
LLFDIGNERELLFERVELLLKLCAGLALDLLYRDLERADFNEQTLMLFHNLGLLAGDTWQVEFSGIIADGGGRVNDRANFGYVGEAHEPGARGYSIVPWLNGKPAGRDPTPGHCLACARDAGGVGNANPGIAGRVGFGARKLFNIFDAALLLGLVLGLLLVGWCLHVIDLAFSAAICAPARSS